MIRHATKLLSLALCLASHAAIADQEVGELTQSGGLFVSVEPDFVSSKCQPLAGNRLVILGYKSNVGGMVGLNVVYVQLMDGPCKNQKGVVGADRVKTIHAD